VNFSKICVLGLGYIGLPTASTFATHGLQVIGVDVNPQVVETLRNGGLHIHEPGLRTLVRAALGSGNLSISDRPDRADAFIIAVPTPIKEDKTADLSYVISAAESIVPYLQVGNLVVLESTSPPRTTIDLVAPILETSGLNTGKDYYLVYSPERVLPGKILHELIENARVMGGVNQESARAGRDLYASFVRGEIHMTDATTAEMVKLMENTFRDINIAVANEFSRLADRLNVNVWEAIKLSNMHPRIDILRPGPGVGGHCISVDPWFLVEAAPDLSQLIRTAREVNDTQPQFVVDWVQRSLGELKGKRIAALGLAYKADVDDLRESPALEVVRLLSGAGADVLAYEPYKDEAQISGGLTVTELDGAIKEVDAILLLVAHEPFKQLDPQEVARTSTARIVFDSVNGWSQEAWQAAGFQFFTLGTGK
jgi:UDP-N-acetyl-D-mannosaminuronic acid dehydrogenase